MTLAFVVRRAAEMSVADLLRAALLIHVISAIVACDNRPQEELRTETFTVNNVLGIDVCPSSVEEDVIKALALNEQNISFHKERLISLWRTMGYSVGDYQYHIFDPECSDHEKAGQLVTHVAIGWQSNDAVFRRYAVHFDERGKLSKIEARYIYGRHP